MGRNNYEPEEEDLEKFLELWTEDAHTLEVEDHSLGKAKVLERARIVERARVAKLPWKMRKARRRMKGKS